MKFFKILFLVFAFISLSACSRDVISLKDVQNAPNNGIALTYSSSHEKDIFGDISKKEVSDITSKILDRVSQKIKEPNFKYKDLDLSDLYIKKPEELEVEVFSEKLIKNAKFKDAIIDYTFIKEKFPERSKNERVEIFKVIHEYILDKVKENKTVKLNDDLLNTLGYTDFISNNDKHLIYYVYYIHEPKTYKDTGGLINYYDGKVLEDKNIIRDSLNPSDVNKDNAKK